MRRCQREAPLIAYEPDISQRPRHALLWPQSGGERRSSGLISQVGAIAFGRCCIAPASPTCRFRPMKSGACSTMAAESSPSSAARPSGWMKCRWKNSKPRSGAIPALDRLCRQARRVGDDRAASSRLGSASQGIRRDDGLDSAQSEQPQQELYARCSRRSLHEFRTTLFGDAQARTPLEPVSKVPVVNRRQPGTAFGNRQEPFSLGGSNRSFCPQRGHCLESVARTQ